MRYEWKQTTEHTFYVRVNRGDCPDTSDYGMLIAALERVSCHILLTSISEITPRYYVSSPYAPDMTDALTLVVKTSING